MPTVDRRKRNLLDLRGIVTDHFNLRKAPISFCLSLCIAVSTMPLSKAQPMGNKKTALLITGLPGVGKTTLIRKVAESLSQWKIHGFLTEEIRIGGKREGFRIRSFEGSKEATLAHIRLKSVYRVGRYGVDIAALNSVVQESLHPSAEVDLYLVDEIGKMECFSPLFRQSVLDLFDSGSPIVATIHRSGGGFTQQVKARPDCLVWELSEKNRDYLPQAVIDWIRQQPVITNLTRNGR